jgi:hypothetical protein
MDGKELVRRRSKKPGAAFRPGDPRSSGEYSLLEDSRYTSQHRRKILQPEFVAGALTI